MEEDAKELGSMKIRLQLLRAWLRFHNLVPADYLDKCVVAGGWAFDPSTASDVDVFVLGVQDEDRWSFSVKEVSPGYENIPRILGVQTVPQIFAGKPVQIIPTTYTSVGELFDYFDILTACVAYPLDEKFFHLPLFKKGWTTTPTLNEGAKITLPWMTMCRMWKYAKKTGEWPDEKSMDMLVTMMHDLYHTKMKLVQVKKEKDAWSLI